VNKKDKKKKWRLIGYAYLVLILFTLWVSATYTWFSISRTPRVSDMALSVSAKSGLELASKWDNSDEEWTQHLNFNELIDHDISPLKPVTWVNEEMSFYTANYGIDGRITNFSTKLSDENNANRDDAYGYYMITSFYARTETAVSVSLAPAITGEDGIEGSGTYVIGTPVWNSESISHDNGGQGAENTIRVGIRITKLDKDGIDKADSVQFYVYEPNYDGHADGEAKGIETYGINGDVLVPSVMLIRQTTSTWTEANPVQHSVVIQELGEFVSDTKLFELDPDEFARIDLYFWMEGQDVDCNYLIGQDAKLMANIQFLAEARSESGLEEF